jgi:BCCIP
LGKRSTKTKKTKKTKKSGFERKKKMRKRERQLSDDEQSASDDDDAKESYEVETLAPGEEEVQVDLALFNIGAQDFFSTKNFLNSYLDGTPWLATELADHVASNERIGTVIRVDDGDISYGFATVVNLHRCSTLQSVRELVKFVLEKLTDREQNATLRSLLADNKEKGSLGLLLNERVVNVPPPIAAPLLSSLVEEIEEAAEIEQSEGVGEAQRYFDMTHYLMMTTVYEASRADDGQGGADQSKRRRPVNALGYFKPEDEIFIDNALFAFSYPLRRNKHQADRWTLGGSVNERRVIALLSADALPKCVAAIANLVPIPDGAIIDVDDPFASASSSSSSAFASSS